MDALNPTAKNDTNLDAISVQIDPVIDIKFER